MASSGTAADFDVVFDRLKAILEPYGRRMHVASDGPDGYSIDQRRPGAKAHDWFAGIQRTGSAVKFTFLPMHGDPSLLEGASPKRLKRRSGASVFKFTRLDEQLVAELEAVVARAFPSNVGE
jgi:hypothetical protein